MTDPDKRKDPWREALSCYEDIADELVVTGQDWPEEFRWDYIGEEISQKGFEKCTGDWVLNFAIDHILHQNDIKKLKQFLIQNSEAPAVVLHQHQIFTPDRYHRQTKLVVAINKKKYPEVKWTGGNDLCLATLNNQVINANSLPDSKIALWNYDKVFGTKDSISFDRARFARAWFRQFNSYGVFGGPTPEEAFNAWFELIKERYKKHVLKLKLSSHPKYIRGSIENLNADQFGHSAFGLKGNTKHKFIDILKAQRYRINNLF